MYLWGNYLEKTKNKQDLFKTISLVCPTPGDFGRHPFSADAIESRTFDLRIFQSCDHKLGSYDQLCHHISLSLILHFLEFKKKSGKFISKIGCFIKICIAGSVRYPDTAGDLMSACDQVIENFNSKYSKVKCPVFQFIPVSPFQ